MASYNPPTEYNPIFNTSLFNQPKDTLSQAEADRLYLSKTKSDISTASSTTFNGAVNLNGSQLKITAPTTSIFTDFTQENSGTFTIGNRIPSGSVSILAQTSGGLNRGINFSSTSFTMNNDVTLNVRQIKSTSTSSSHTLFDDMLASGTLTIGGTASTNNIRGNTTFPQNVTIGTDGVSNDLSLKGELRCYDTSSPYTTYSKIITNGTSVYYDAPIGISTSHIFKTYNSSGVLTGSQFEVTATANISRQIHTFTNRINWSVTSYNFGSFTNGNLGYYLKATGSSQPLTNNVSTTILTTSSIPAGVWRIDFSVQLNAIATGSHSITQSQSYLSTISNGAIATAIPFTGSTLRSHTSETYAQNDIQILTSNITYNQSSAGVLYLNVLRTFTTGTFTAIGEVSITRIA